MKCSVNREAFELEAHITAMYTELKHEKILNDRLKELREHNDKFAKKLKNEHEQRIQDKEERHSIEITKNQAEYEKLAKETVENVAKPQ